MLDTPAPSDGEANSEANSEANCEANGEAPAPVQAIADGTAPVHTENLCRQLVRALRGDRSQRALSRRLQYTTNVVYLWESGRRWPTAAAFLWLAHRTGVSVGAALASFGPEEGLGDEPWRPSAVAALLRHLKGRVPATTLAKRLGVSRHAVGRWLRGEAEPKLPDLLRFVEATSTRMLDFVARFVDPLALPAAAPHWDRLVAARLMTREQPWAPAVLLALELRAYQSLPEHDDAWLATRLGLTPHLVAECLSLLAAAGQIQARDGRWSRVEVQAVDTGAPSRPMDLKRWWAGVALDRLDTAQGTASFTVCAVSQADFDALQQAQRQHYRALRARIAASTPGERVVLLNLQTLALDRP
jgi:transcriptional regulator with XRE-family HTH domain